MITLYDRKYKYLLTPLTGDVHLVGHFENLPSPSISTLIENLHLDRNYVIDLSTISGVIAESSL